MYRYEIDETRKLVSVVASGEADLRASKEMLAAIVGDARYTPSADFLVDVRSMTAAPSSDDLSQFSEALARVKTRCGRFAVVASPGVQFGLGRMLATLAGFRGIEIYVCREPDEARAWLGPLRDPAGH